MSDEITPALTPEQWRWFGEYDTWTFINSACEPGHSRAPEVAGDKLDHALAAIALRGQPYGFTRDDVDWLRQIAAFLDTPAVAASDYSEALAARIAALLPPEAP